MPFTNIFDVTFPADIQLANLLGQDLRNLALNVQQRMAAISGLDAAKPAFGSDTQPANWNGILFFALDTGKVYQFNNPSWTEVTFSVASGRLFNDHVDHVNTGNTTENTIYTTTIKGGTVDKNGTLITRVDMTIGSQASGSSTIRLKLGGTTFHTINAGSVAAPVHQRWDWSVYGRNATNVQLSRMVQLNDNASGTVAFLDSTQAIDMTADQVLAVTAQSLAVGNSQTYSACDIMVQRGV